MRWLDIGATHNFVTDVEARRLGLTLKKESGHMKSVNSMPISDVARQVGTKLGDWEGELNYTVVNMDDFNLVLGMVILRTSKAVVMLCIDSLSVAGKQTCLIRSSEIKDKNMKGPFL